MGLRLQYTPRNSHLRVVSIQSCVTTRNRKVPNCSNWPVNLFDRAEVRQFEGGAEAGKGLQSPTEPSASTAGARRWAWGLGPWFIVHWSPFWLWVKMIHITSKTFRWFPFLHMHVLFSLGYLHLFVRQVRKLKAALSKRKKEAEAKEQQQRKEKETLSSDGHGHWNVGYYCQSKYSIGVLLILIADMILPTSSLLSYCGCDSDNLHAMFGTWYSGNGWALINF